MILPALAVLSGLLSHQADRKSPSLPEKNGSVMLVPVGSKPDETLKLGVAPVGVPSVDANSSGNYQLSDIRPGEYVLVAQSFSIIDNRTDNVDRDQCEKLLGFTLDTATTVRCSKLTVPSGSDPLTWSWTFRQRPSGGY